MRQGRPGLKASSALPSSSGSLGGALGGALAGVIGGMLPATPALANCTGGPATTCDTDLAQSLHTNTVGTGRNDHNRTVNVLAGAQIVVTNQNAISLGDNARINLASGALVQGTYRQRRRQLRHRPAADRVQQQRHADHPARARR